MTRRTDPIRITAASLDAAKDEVAQSWAREFADPDSYWYKFAIGKVGA